MATVEALIKVVEGLCTAHDTLCRRIALLEKLVRHVHDSCITCPGNSLAEDDKIVDEGEGLIVRQTWKAG